MHLQYGEEKKTEVNEESCEFQLNDCAFESSLRYNDWN